MLHIGIDVHQKSSVFNVFNPVEGDGGTHRSQKVETTAEGFRRVLEPLAGRCEVVFEVRAVDAVGRGPGAAARGQTHRGESEPHSLPVSRAAARTIGWTPGS